MKLFIAILSILIVASCSTTTKTNTSQILQPKENTATSSPSVATSVPAPATRVVMDKLDSEIQQLEKQSDYFDFDKSAIKPEYLAVIKKEAEFLKDHRNDVVTLEGNADERGSIEYNYELGNRRANSVRNTLVSLGVPDTQIHMISYGKEKPRLMCHEEKCWKENRRVDFMHKLGS